MKHYIISASKFDSLKASLDQIDQWQELGDLKEGTVVYEITEKTKRYIPAISLEEVK